MIFVQYDVYNVTTAERRAAKKMRVAIFGEGQSEPGIESKVDAHKGRKDGQLRFEAFVPTEGLRPRNYRMRATLPSGDAASLEKSFSVVVD